MIYSRTMRKTRGSAAAVPAGVGSPMVAAQKAKPAKAELRWKGPVVWR